MYLAAIADSQPQPPTMHSQFPPSGIMQPGGHYLQQHQQAQQMTPQSLMAARSSMLYSQQQFSALQQQQALHSQLGMSSGGSSGLHMLQSEANSSGTTGGALGAGGFPDFGRGSTGEGLQASGRGKQEIGSSEGRGGGSSGGNGGEGGESLYLKAGEDGN
ncbi:GRF1-interacting factor 1 isoform X2 [Camellia sinensis]|nr:GRF1-interacting factor 1 isoform X2 [Camellia sinensis]XP_028063679.1 GRF1-interacting factor 1 isoform X2 [Camellia sinensis]